MLLILDMMSEAELDAMRGVLLMLESLLEFMFEVLEAVAKSSIVLDEQEQAVIDRFRGDLLNEFRSRYEND